jgi:hypothetical protein
MRIEFKKEKEKVILGNLCKGDTFKTIRGEVMVMNEKETGSDTPVYVVVETDVGENHYRVFNLLSNKIEMLVRTLEVFPVSLKIVVER